MDFEDGIRFVCCYAFRDNHGVDLPDVLLYCVLGKLVNSVIFNVFSFIVPVLEYCFFHMSKMIVRFSEVVQRVCG